MQAVLYFEKFFEAARSVGDMRVLDVARCNLGIARAAATKDDFMAVVTGDLDALLNWKTLRVPFVEQL